MPNEDLKKEIAEVAAETLAALLKASKEADEKEKPKVSWFNMNVKSIGSSLAGIVAILGSVWAIDTHYASAADVTKMQVEFSNQIRQMRQEKADDELYALDSKKQAQHGKLSPADQASYMRLQRRSQQIQAETLQSQQQEKK